MKFIYINTSEVDLDTFLKFCFKRIKQNKNDFLIKNWDKSIKNSYMMYHSTCELILVNNFGEYIAGLETPKIGVGDNIYIWEINNIEQILCYELEFFDFENYSDLLTNEKYKISSMGLTRNKNWIYMEIENVYTHYRCFVLNIQNFISFKKYIRQERIGELFD